MLGFKNIVDMKLEELKLLKERIEFLNEHGKFGTHKAVPIPFKSKKTNEEETIFVDELIVPLVQFINTLPNTETISSCQKGRVDVECNYPHELTEVYRKLDTNQFRSRGEIGQFDLTGGIEIEYYCENHYVIKLYDMVSVMEMNYKVFGIEPPPKFAEAKKFFNMTLWSWDLEKLKAEGIDSLLKST